MKTWSRYLVRKIATMFLFLCGCLFFLYVLIDLSTHGPRFLSWSIEGVRAVCCYYGYSFCLQLKLFGAVAFVLACLKALFDLAMHLEFVALQMGGLSRSRILMPFLWCGAVVALLLYANQQWVVPNVDEQVEAFQAAHRKRPKKKDAGNVYSMPLEDGSEWVYHRLNGDRNSLQDLFWIRSGDEIWHVKELFLEDPLRGVAVDRFVRNEQHLLEKRESFDSHLFTGIEFCKEDLDRRFVPLDRRSISSLRQHHASAHLHYQIALPLLPGLLVWVLAPFALQFRRTGRLFALTAIAILGLVALWTFFDGLLILGENQVIPGWALWTPLMALAGFAQVRKLVVLNM
jgi:lipopolysaccharide export LptBFGC system permease protein LptF